MPKAKRSSRTQNGRAEKGKPRVNKKARNGGDNVDVDHHKNKGLDFSSPEEAFSRLLHPITTPTFLEKFWEKQPVIITESREEKRALFESLFTRTILEKIVAEKKVSFVRDCNVCKYEEGVRKSLNGKGLVKPGQMRDLLDKSKATIQFHQPQRFQDRIWQLLEQLESFFGCLVGANIYMTPQGSQGLAPHYDDVEVFVLQLEGEKHWRLYPPPITLPRDYSRDFHQSEIGTPTHDIVLKAGDLMYFPRGTVHQADTPTTCSHSTHLTISTYQRSSWGDLLSIALPSIIENAITETVSLRQGLPLRFTYDVDGQATSSKTTATIQRLLQQLGQHIGSHSQEAANEMLCEFLTNRLPPYHDGMLDISPSGPMPTAEHKVRLRFPRHTFIVTRQRDGDDDDEDDDEDEEEEEEDEEEKHTVLFAYHSLLNDRDDHMMSSEPRQPNGVQLPMECEAALKALKTAGQTWQSFSDVEVEDDAVKTQMLVSLWAEGLLDVMEAGKS